MSPNQKILLQRLIDYWLVQKNGIRKFNFFLKQFPEYTKEDIDDALISVSQFLHSN